MNENKTLQGRTVSLIGHPYAPIGMGEHLRTTHRAMRSVEISPGLMDVYKLIIPDTSQTLEFAKSCTNKFADINIFHINGDEVEQCLAHLGVRQQLNGYNIIYPAWELERYPDEWASLLDRFDEIWAMSKFIKDSIMTNCKKPVIHMPSACEVVLDSFLSRRYFGIPETDYVFLSFFDVRSFIARKNPFLVIDCFRQLVKENPYKKIKLVIKVNGADMMPSVMQQIQDSIQNIIDSVVVLNNVMTENEVKNLLRCSDCFVSLHRSEGYGRGIAEAMALGKPVIATGYSGNMDFMNDQVSLPVKYKMISLLDGDYPHWQNQVWADPDAADAFSKMTQLLRDQEFGRVIGHKAKLHMQTHFSFGAIGMSYLNHLEKIGFVSPI